MSCDSQCSGAPSQLMDGGAKGLSSRKKRPLNAWILLVIKMKKENPSKDLKEVIIMAKPIYKKMKASGEIPMPKSADAAPKGLSSKKAPTKKTAPKGLSSRKAPTKKTPSRKAATKRKTSSKK